MLAQGKCDTPEFSDVLTAVKVTVALDTFGHLGPWIIEVQVLRVGRYLNFHCAAPHL